MPRQRQTNLVGSSYGQFVKRPSDSLTEKKGAAGLSTEAIEWKPNRRILKRVPQDFRLPLQLVTGDDGVRRILPGCNVGEFLVRAATGGLAVMQRARKLTKDDRQSYRLMSFLFQWSFSDRRLMSRTIRRAEDLRLRQSERSGDSERNVLPDIETINRLNKPERLTVDGLLKCGRESASERGISADSISRQINLGLLAVAAQSSNRTIRSSFQDSAGIIRFSLFGIDQGEPSNDDVLKALVEERLIQAVRKHLDSPDEKFRKWMWEDFDNIVHQLAQRKSRQGGPVSRQQVRFILFDLLWRSFG